MIPKKRGGERRLLIPDPHLKAMQRRLLHRLFKRLRAHPAAHGFERGRSIVTNALPHQARAVVIKIDLVDFFPTTRRNRIEQYFRRIGWNAEAAALLTNLCTTEGGLPQGAPTSPRLSNLVNFNMDSRIARYVHRHKGNYTRYADDITISFPHDYPRRIRGTIQRVKRIAKMFGYAIHVRGKLQILRRHQRQRVTGLVVNERVQLPRRVRRWLRAVEHRLKKNGSATLTTKQLAGWRALQAMIQKRRAVSRDDTSVRPGPPPTSGIRPGDPPNA
jgi:retron-type reverse transcriptase